MKRVHGFHRKRPHILPPLRNSQQSSLRPVDVLQPPDLLLTKNRFGSPIPRPKNPSEFDYICNETNDKPAIRIDEDSKKESEDRNLMKFDLLSGPILNKTDGLLHQVQQKNILRMPDLYSQRGEGLSFNNLSPKQLEKTHDDPEKNIKFQMILPLEGSETTNTPRPNCFQIRNRYKPLKPIGEGKNEG